MSTRQIHVFISHSWWYSNHYEKLEDWIFVPSWRVGQASLDFRNYSVPKDDPIHNARSDKLLQNAIYRQIQLSHVIVIPTGMYAHYSKWIQKEIDGARLYRKPILGVNIWGAQRTASVVRNAAAKLIGWNREPLITAIWELYRGPRRTVI